MDAVVALLEDQYWSRAPAPPPSAASATGAPHTPLPPSTAAGPSAPSRIELRVFGYLERWMMALSVRAETVAQRVPGEEWKDLDDAAGSAALDDPKRRRCAPPHSQPHPQPRIG